MVDFYSSSQRLSMVYDDTDEQGRLDWLFLDQVNGDLLYVHIGINGNDSVLILFKEVKEKTRVYIEIYIIVLQILMWLIQIKFLLLPVCFF